MTSNQSQESQSSAERLQSLLVNSFYDDLSPDALSEGLDTIRKEAAGQLFELRADPEVDPVVFCAGSWSVKYIYGSGDPKPQVTILGKNDVEGTPLSPFQNKGFSILQHE